MNVPPASPAVQQNVVCTVSLGRSVNIEEVCICLNGRLGRNTFPATLTRSVHPRAAISLFESGNLVSVGNKDVPSALLTIYKFVNRIREDLCIDVGVYNFKVTNVVGSCSMGFPIDLDMFKVDHDCDTTFEPELFRGLAYKPEPEHWPKFGGKVSFTVFESGNINIVGCMTQQHMETAYKAICEMMENYKLVDGVSRAPEDKRRTRPQFIKKSKNKRRKPNN